MKTKMTINKTTLAALVAAGLALSSLQSNAIAGSRPISGFLSRQGKFCFQVGPNGFFDCAASHYTDDTSFTTPGT